MLSDNTSRCLRDYKIFCFEGKAEFCQVISDRNSKETIDFFDRNWVKLPFSGLHLPEHEYPHSRSKIECPKTWRKMVEFSEILSRGISFLRVDFYEVNEQLFFGELTFYPASGFGVFSPDEVNYKIGEMIDLDLLNSR